MADLSPQAVEACHDLIVWMIGKLDDFPRARRYTLGTRIETLLLDVLERLLMAAYARPPDKSHHLELANTKLDLLRHVWRIALEVHVVSSKAHRHGAGLMLDIGAQIGGWRKATASR